MYKKDVTRYTVDDYLYEIDLNSDCKAPKLTQDLRRYDDGGVGLSKPPTSGQHRSDAHRGPSHSEQAPILIENIQIF